MSIQKTFITFLFVALIFIFLAPIAQQTTPNAIVLENILHAPNFKHLAGTDELGRDILARLGHGIKISLFVGISVLIIAGTIGTIIGVFAGYVGGWVDNALMRITDIFLSFPGILIAITFAALAGPGVENVIFALGLMGWVSFARLARVQVLSIKNMEYMQAATLTGVKTPRMIFKYILPNISAPLIVESVFTIAGAMISEAGLSFLGIGIQPPEPSLGTMLREGSRYMLVAPHLVLAPGLTLMVLVFSMNLIGDRLRDKLDVRYSAKR